MIISSRIRIRFFLASLPLLAASSLPAQESSRTAEIEAAQRAKAAALKPDVPGKVERKFILAQKLLSGLESGPDGAGVKFGGLVSGSGFAAGPQYVRRDLWRERLQFRALAVFSVKRYEMFQVEFGLPHLLHDHAFVDLDTRYRNYPSLNYYGPGPNSFRNGRSDYRYETSSSDLTAGVSPKRFLRIGGTLGYLLVNVGAGTDHRFVSTEQIYPPSLAPGIDRQTNFLRGGGFVQIDLRDNPGDPHAGINLLARFLAYDDRDLGQFNFQRLQTDAQGYIPFFNKTHVIALRGRADFSYTRAGQQVPFYLQPTLGGGEDLRGFRPFRFYDNNSLLFTAEYRWEIFTGFDMALFADAGKVAAHRADLDLGDLRADAGFGLRIKTRSAVVMRIDTGFSNEGFQVWLKFGNVF